MLGPLRLEAQWFQDLLAADGPIECLPGAEHRPGPRTAGRIGQSPCPGYQPRVQRKGQGADLGPEWGNTLPREQHGGT